MDDMNFDYINYIAGLSNNNMMNNYSGNNIMDKMNDNNITNPLAGFIRGNMFSNLYDQYKNYKPIKIKKKNSKEDLLNKWRQYNFAIVELNLYLDTNPNDIEKIRLLNNYIDMERELQEKYESMYGQLSIDSNNAANTFTWIKKPWPWEGGK